MVDSQYLKQHLSKFDFDQPELKQFFQCIPYIRKAAIYCVKCLHESREKNGRQKLENENEKMNYDFKIPVTLLDLNGYYSFLEQLICSLINIEIFVNLTRNQIYDEWHHKIMKYEQNIVEKKAELAGIDNEIQSHNEKITRRDQDRKSKEESINHERTMLLNSGFEDVLKSIFVSQTHIDDILCERKIEDLEKDLNEIKQNLSNLRDEYNTLKDRHKLKKEELEKIQNILTHTKSRESIYSGLIEDLSKFQYQLSNMKVSMEACLYGIKLFNLNDNNANDNIVRLSTYLFETGSTVYVSTDTKSINVLSALFAARYFQQFKQDLSDLDKVKYSEFMDIFNEFALPLIKSKLDNEKDFFMEGFIEKDSSMKEVKRSYANFKVTYDSLSTDGKIQSLVDLP
ncbi:hypothetical protein LC607_29615 [Nostoc sp. CHAB 5824]|nr:hypothetical protein [Nostoc sp. CHAB 5824]